MPEIGTGGDVGKVSSSALSYTPTLGKPNKSLDVLAAGADNLSKEAGAASTRLQKAQDRVQAREDLIHRGRAENEYELFLQTEEEDLTNADTTDNKVLSTFGDRSTEMKNKIRAAHPGSPASMAALTASLDAIQGRSVSRVSSLINTAQTAMLNDQFKTQMARVIAATQGNVNSVLAQFKAADILRQTYAPIWSPEQEDAARRTGNTDIVLAAITPLLARGSAQDLAAVEELLNRDDVKGTLEPAVYRSQLAQLTKGQHDATRSAREIEEGMVAIEIKSGRPRATWTQEQRDKIAGMLIDKGETLGEKVRAFEAAVNLARGPNKPVYRATENDIRRLTNTFAEDNPAGTSRLGRAQARVARNLDRYDQGLLTGEELILFQQALLTIQEPHPRTDPRTGQTMWFPGLLSPHVADTVRRVDPDLLREAPPSARETIEGRVREDGTIKGLGTVELADTIFWSAHNITGIIPKTRAFLLGIPGVAFLGSEAAKAANTKIQQEILHVANALRASPRFNDNEVKRITDSLQLQGRLLDTLPNYRANLHGLDLALKVRQEEALQFALDVTTDAANATHDWNVARALANFRLRLGMPPIINSAAEMKQKIPPGGWFRLPDGEILMHKPGARPHLLVDPTGRHSGESEAPAYADPGGAS